MALLSAFNPHEFSEATIRAVATGREDDLKEILESVLKNLGASSIQHLIVSAPRGYGKSFLLRHAQFEIERIARDEKLPLATVLMPEEMPHVKEPETLIREIARALSGGAAADAQLTWHEDDGEDFAAAAEALDKAIVAKVGERGLSVAMVENFDLLLRRAFPKEVQRSRLREFLAAPGGRLMLIAASASGAFDRDYDSRLFQAFREVALTPWTVDECLKFFDRQRRDAGKPPLDDLARARARAVALFIGGAPRLATLIGNVLLGEDVLGAAELLRKLVDELTPYYKERIEALPGRSQKLLDALLRGGEPATPSEIARRVKAMSQSAIAGPLSDLVKERVAVSSKATGSAEALYRVADRVFAHYYRFRVIEHGKDLCPLEGLVDLLAEFFTPDEKRGKAGEFALAGRLDEARVMARLADQDSHETQLARAWILFDLETIYVPRRLATLATASVAAELREIAHEARAGSIDAARQRIDAALKIAAGPEDRVAVWLARSRLDAYEGFGGGLAAAEKAVQCAAVGGSDKARLVAENGRVWSLFLSGRYSRALAEGGKAAALAKAMGDAGAEAVAGRLAAYSLGALGRHEEAVEQAERAAVLAKEAGDMQEQAEARHLAANSLGALGRHEEAVEQAERAAKLAKEAGDPGGEAAAWRHAAYSLGALGRHEKAVEQAERAATLAKEVGDPRAEAVARRLVAFSLGRLGRHDQAVAQAERSATLANKVGDMREEAVARRYAALSLGQLGRHQEAVEQAERAAMLAKEVGDMREEAEARHHAAFYLSELGRHSQAILEAESAATLLDKFGTARAASGFDFDKEAQYLVSDAGRIGRRAANVLCREAAASASVDFTASLHNLFAPVSQLELGEVGSRVLDAWLVGTVAAALRVETSPDRFNTLAEAIAIHFPDRVPAERQRLVDAAAYHRSGRSRAALERLDPDFAKLLETMHPPRDQEAEKKPRQRAKAAKAKR